MNSFCIARPTTRNIVLTARQALFVSPLRVHLSFIKAVACETDERLTSRTVCTQ